jgi:hypothetical protein
MVIARSELIEHLEEQLYFLDASCVSYDNGAFSEAKRLASTVRVLVHDTPGRNGSTSLLQHLGMKQTMTFRELIPKSFLALAEERTSQPTWAGVMPLLAVISMQPGSTEYQPTFNFLSGEVEADARPFEEWWMTPRLFSPRTSVSRRQIVIWLANKAGGAHVDQLPEAYRSLAHEGGMGFTVGGPLPDQESYLSPFPTAMRQIAEETRVSIRTAMSSYDSIVPTNT